MMNGFQPHDDPRGIHVLVEDPERFWISYSGDQVRVHFRCIADDGSTEEVVISLTAARMQELGNLLFTEAHSPLNRMRALPERREPGDPVGVKVECAPFRIPPWATHPKPMPS
jgi:hypothetical protein